MHASVKPKVSIQKLQKVRETLKEIKMVSYLPYNFYKNIILDLSKQVNTVNGGNIIIFCKTGLNIPKIHIFIYNIYIYIYRYIYIYIYIFIHIYIYT